MLRESSSTHRDDVLLVHGGADDERGTEEAEEDQGQRKDPQRGQDDPVAHASFVHAHALVRQDSPGGDHPDEQRRGERLRRQVEAELALLENERAVREKCLKNPVKHG